MSTRNIKINSGISIHALRGEGDVTRHKSCRRQAISIHALRGEGDGGNQQEHS